MDVEYELIAVTTERLGISGRGQEVILKAHTLTVGAPRGESSVPLVEEDEWLVDPQRGDRAAAAAGVARRGCPSSPRSARPASTPSRATRSGSATRSRSSRATSTRSATSPTTRAAQRAAGVDGGPRPALDKPTLDRAAVRGQVRRGGVRQRATSRYRARARTVRRRGIFHLPAARMRRLGDRSGYVLLVAGPAASSRRARASTTSARRSQYDGEGSPAAPLAAGQALGQQRGDPVQALLAPRAATTGCRATWRWRSSTSGDKLAAQSNVSFFDSSGTPPTIIFVQGEEQKDGTRVTFKVPRETSRPDRRDAEVGRRPPPPRRASCRCRPARPPRRSSSARSPTATWASSSSARTTRAARWARSGSQPIFVVGHRGLGPLHGRGPARHHARTALRSRAAPLRAPARRDAAARPRLRPPARRLPSPGGRGRRDAPLSGERHGREGRRSRAASSGAPTASPPAPRGTGRLHAGGRSGARRLERRAGQRRSARRALRTGAGPWTTRVSTTGSEGAPRASAPTRAATCASWTSDAAVTSNGSG